MTLLAVWLCSQAGALEAQIGITVGVTTAREERLLGNVYLGLDGGFGFLKRTLGRWRPQVGVQAEARLTLLGRRSFAMGGMVGVRRTACVLPSTGANLELGAALEKGHSGIRFGGAVFGYVHQTRVTATIGPGVPQVAFAIGNHADGSERCRYNL